MTVDRGASRHRWLAATAMAFALSACASGMHPAAVRTTARTAPAIVVHRSATASHCDDRLPASPPLVGAARVDMVLVPIAAIRVDVCVYHDGTLASHATVLDGAGADRIENAANTLQGQDPGTGGFCEPHTSSRVVVQFDDGIHTTSVDGAIGGCPTITNGFLSATATPPWIATRHKLLSAADTCTRQFGALAGCVATGSW